CGAAAAWRRRRPDGRRWPRSARRRGYAVPPRTAQAATCATGHAASTRSTGRGRPRGGRTSACRLGGERGDGALVAEHDDSVGLGAAAVGQLPEDPAVLAGVLE